VIDFPDPRSAAQSADNGCLRSDSRATSRPCSPRRASSRWRAFSIGTWVGLLPGRCRY